MGALLIKLERGVSSGLTIECSILSLSIYNLFVHFCKLVGKFMLVFCRISERCSLGSLFADIQVIK